MTKYYVELRAAVRRNGAPNLIPLDQLPGQVGFRSVFAYPEETAAVIRAQGSTSYLRGLAVYADVLLVDFDNCTGEVFERRLRDQGIGYEKYHSGGRSIHYHVALSPIEGAWVPAACKAWVQATDNTADVSYFNPSGQFRLPGTFHHKNLGQCKELLYSVAGEPLVLHEPPETELAELAITGGEEAIFAAATKHCNEGQRRPHAWRIASCCAEAGWPQERAMEIVMEWNDRFCTPPHDPQDLVSQILKAYRRHGRRYG